MSQWANEHPEQMEEIAHLPLNEQNAAMRAAIGYDPDAIRDRLEEDRIHHHRPLNTSAGGDVVVPPYGSGSTPPAADPRRRTGMSCDNCGAPEDVACQPWCRAEQYS